MRGIAAAVRFPGCRERASAVVDPLDGGNQACSISRVPYEGHGGPARGEVDANLGDTFLAAQHPLQPGGAGSAGHTRNLEHQGLCLFGRRL